MAYGVYPRIAQCVSTIHGANSCEQSIQVGIGLLSFAPLEQINIEVLN